MILLLSDFGLEGPYVGQVKSAIWARTPGVPVVDLFADLPAYDVQAAAYLLDAYRSGFPRGSVFLAVVDPGVGGARDAVAVEADGDWYVGPDNGLFALVVRRADHCVVHEIKWRPGHLSASFHGRDLFAPVAAALARGDTSGLAPRNGLQVRGAEWPEELPRVVYVDRFGNALTGLRAAAFPPGAGLQAGERTLPRVRTFGGVPVGAPLCYENSNGLLEIAVNQGSAAAELGLTVGSPVTVAA